jgi:hypothetical protein
LRLKDLAPEIGVDGNGFPLHGGSGWVGEEVEAINEADGGRVSRGECRGGRRSFDF